MSEDTNQIDRQRYRRILWFFAGIILHLILYDILATRLPYVRDKVRATRPERFREMSRDFRTLAAQMGGVMIKLGQFLSARVDVLPPEIIEELVGLQDEVPAEPYDLIRQQLDRELGDLTQHFAAIDKEPLAAASLGQVHQAWLLPERVNGGLPLGKEVVVKVQRPDIEMIVNTDLAALQVVASWMMRYKPIRKRADMPRLMSEFAKTLWEELDYRAEATNAERFSLIFADDDDVVAPHVYWAHSTGRLLTLEKIVGMKIDDVVGMENAGISPIAVSERLLDIYFTQIFQAGFFHADPHAGNVFLRKGETTPFQIVFIDFGMMGRIESELSSNLRRVLLSVVKQDARALTEVYDDMGFFLPSADLDRITEAQAEVLGRIWGRSMAEMANPDMAEVKELGLQFRDILAEFPFQVPQDFIYLGRALGMISGLTTQLNPNIDAWGQLSKFAGTILQDESINPFSFDNIAKELQDLLAFPAQARRLIQSAERGELKVKTVQDAGTTRRLDRLERKVSNLNTGLITIALLGCGTLLYVNGSVGMGWLFWGIAGITAVANWLKN